MGKVYLARVSNYTYSVIIGVYATRDKAEEAVMKKSKSRFEFGSSIEGIDTEWRYEWNNGCVVEVYIGEEIELSDWEYVWTDPKYR